MSTQKSKYLASCSSLYFVTKLVPGLLCSCPCNPHGACPVKVCLFEAPAAAHLSVGVDVRRNCVGHHCLQDVVLCRHDVFDQKVGCVINVEVILS